MEGAIETSDGAQGIGYNQVAETDQQTDSIDNSGDGLGKVNEADSSSLTDDAIDYPQFLETSSCNYSQIQTSQTLSLNQNVDAPDQSKVGEELGTSLKLSSLVNPLKITNNEESHDNKENDEPADAPEDNFHALYNSMVENDFHKLNHLVTERKVDINHDFIEPFIELPYRGWRLVHFLCKKGNVIGLKSVIALGADPTAKTGKGDTALHICSKHGHFECVEYLLTVDDSLKDVQDFQGLTPLLKAMFRCDTVFKEKAYMKTIKALLNAGCNVNLCPDSNYSPLHVVANKWDSTMIIQLLIKAGADVNAIAAQKGPVVTKYQSPLNTALNRQKVNQGAVKLLIDAGANVNYKNLSGKTPLHIAVSKSEDICVRHLLKAGSDPNIADDDGNSPLWIAVSENNIKIAPLLLAYGGNVNFCNKPYRMSLLCKAAFHRYVKMVEILLDHDADVNTQTALGANALHYAVDEGDLRIIKMLLQKNCDMENISLFKDLYNPQTTFQIALGEGNEQVIKLLCEVGCPIREFSLKRERLPRILEGVDELVDWLYNFHYNPRTLLDMSRVYIRKMFGVRLPEVVDALLLENAIPHRVADCILMTDLLE